MQPGRPEKGQKMFMKMICKEKDGSANEEKRQAVLNELEKLKETVPEMFKVSESTAKPFQILGFSVQGFDRTV